MGVPTLIVDMDPSKCNRSFGMKIGVRCHEPLLTGSDLANRSIYREKTYVVPSELDLAAAELN